MAHTFQRSAERHLHVERTPLAGSCPECGAQELAAYRVLSDGGFFDVQQVSALPPLALARAGTAVRLLRAARARDRAEPRVMLGVDVGGTFTDVVSVRDGKISVTKVPSDARDPAGPVVRGRTPPRRRGSAGLQPCEHDGAQRGDHADAAEGRLPHHRGPPRHARPRPRLAPARPHRRTPRGGAPSATYHGRWCRATCAAA